MNYFIKIRFILLFSILFTFASGCSKNAGQSNANGEDRQTPDNQPTAQLTQLDSVKALDYIKNHPEFKDFEKLVKTYYRDRNWKLGWFKEGQLVPQTQGLLDFMGRAEEEALNPKDYQFIDFPQLIKEYEETRDEAERLKKQQDLEIALTAAYFNYGSDFYRGIVNPRKT